MAPSSLSPFHLYTPRPYAQGSEHLVVSSTHAISGRYIYHTPFDAYNAKKSDLERAVLSYAINGNSYDLVGVDDLLALECTPEDGSLEGHMRNIVGACAEEVARRITKRWLRTQFHSGKRKGIFDRGFDPEKREGYVLTNTNDLILKIERYPNLVLLKKDEKEQFSYRKIKEIDGMFDYHDGGNHHILIMESKCGVIDMHIPSLQTELFEPMQTLFPSASFTYVLMAHEQQLFRRKPFRALKSRPKRIFHHLQACGVDLVCLPFNEQEEEMDKIKRHILEQYHLVKNLPISITSRVDFAKDALSLRVNDVVFMRFSKMLMQDGTVRYVQDIDQ